MTAAIAIVADTHARPLPDACLTRLRTAQLIIHAGDIVSVAAWQELQQLRVPISAVQGNCDEAALVQLLPARVELEAGGLRIGLLHDAGPARGRLERMRAAFPGCELVVFGHSHVPLHERADDGFQLFNPGSATQRRRQPRHTMGLLADRRLQIVAV